MYGPLESYYEYQAVLTFPSRELYKPFRIIQFWPWSPLSVTVFGPRARGGETRNQPTHAKLAGASFGHALACNQDAKPDSCARRAQALLLSKKKK